MTGTANSVGHKGEGERGTSEALRGKKKRSDEALL